jgi:hypothetical protein
MSVISIKLLKIPQNTEGVSHKTILYLLTVISVLAFYGGVAAKSR